MSKTVALYHFCIEDEHGNMTSGLVYFDSKEVYKEYPNIVNKFKESGGLEGDVIVLSMTRV